jgi:hypothetical protein
MMMDIPKASLGMSRSKLHGIMPIVWINGWPGMGKHTISKLLKAKLEDVLGVDTKVVRKVAIENLKSRPIKEEFNKGDDECKAPSDILMSLWYRCTITITSTSQVPSWTAAKPSSGRKSAGD